MNTLYLLTIATIAGLSMASENAVYSEKCGTKTPLRLNPKSLFETRPVGFSQITIDRYSGVVTISGQTSMQVDDKVKGESVVDQIKYVTENLMLALAAIDAKPHSVIRLLINIVDYDHEVHLPLVVKLGQQFGHPSITILGVQRLALPNIFIEVEAMSRVSSSINKLLSFCNCDGYHLDPDCKLLRNSCNSDELFTDSECKLT